MLSSRPWRLSGASPLNRRFRITLTASCTTSQVISSISVGTVLFLFFFRGMVAWKTRNSRNSNYARCLPPLIIFIIRVEPGKQWRTQEDQILQTRETFVDFFIYLISGSFMHEYLFHIFFCLFHLTEFVFLCKKLMFSYSMCMY